MCKNNRCWIESFDISHYTDILLLPQNFTDEGVSHLKSLMALRYLNLTSCAKITGFGLRNLTSLTKLDLGSCKNISDKGMSHLKSLKTLRELNLAFCAKITGVGLRNLASLI